jgi:hypothetical protein
VYEQVSKPEETLQTNIDILEHDMKPVEGPRLVSFPLSKATSPKPEHRDFSNQKDQTPTMQEIEEVNLAKLNFNTPNHIVQPNYLSMTNGTKPNTAMTSRQNEDLNQESTTFNMVKEQNSTMSNISKFRSS